MVLYNLSPVLVTAQYLISDKPLSKGLPHKRVFSVSVRPGAERQGQISVGVAESYCFDLKMGLDMG